ncbi:MAG: homoserine dehydrogenase [Alphaproteobacteria bacterium]|nr:MAG: homoserine dehydrogenase [Alphaproteobacteria bacterium]
MKSTLKIAIAGLGTVGVGTVKILESSRELLKARSGCDVTVTAVSARSKGKDRGVELSGYAWFDDAAEMAREADADVFVELVGGSDGIALESVKAALERGLSVVTANKALLAAHGVELARLAEAKGAHLGYEAAVAGGIPIIKSMREGLAGNQIDRIYGILNGTCNYILTKMEATGETFGAVLEEAQAKGYAEADPTFDVGGIDTAHKLSLLAALGFGVEVNFDEVTVEGIETITAEDIAYARELGYRIKLLGVATRTALGIEQRVHPCLVPLGAPIAAVDDVFNAVVVNGDAVGQATFEGRGAGEGPTASAVVSDLVDIARGAVLPTFGIAASALEPLKVSAMEHHEGAYYLRLQVIDQPGVMAAITVILAECGVSIDSIIQRGRAPGESVPVVILTHETKESVMMTALEQFRDQDAVTAEPQLIRIENF